MAKGSFTGLYTFEEVAQMYEMSNSNLRKMVQASKFIENKEIKKFGKTWLITEEAIRKHFGNNIDVYFKKLKLIEIEEARSNRIKKKIANGDYKKSTKNNSTTDFGADEGLGEVQALDYIEVDPKLVVSSFSFSDNQN